MEQFTYRVIIEPDGKKFHAYVPALPGCHTFGKTILDAQKQIQEALELYIETLAEAGETIPRDEGFGTFLTVSVEKRKKRSAKPKRQYA